MKYIIHDTKCKLDQPTACFVWNTATNITTEWAPITRRDPPICTTLVEHKLKIALYVYNCNVLDYYTHKPIAPLNEFLQQHYPELLI